MSDDVSYKIYTKDLFIKMMRDIDYSYDVYFRMAVIDEYLKGNEAIWNLYNKVQYTRINQISKIPKEMLNHKYEFILLIKNVKDNGFNFDNPLLVNEQYMVIDGAHRMACALYFNIPEISIYTNKKYKKFIPNEYTKSWFVNNSLMECLPYAEKQKKKIKEEWDYV